MKLPKEAEFEFAGQKVVTMEVNLVLDEISEDIQDEQSVAKQNMRYNQGVINWWQRKFGKELNHSEAFALDIMARQKYREFKKKLDGGQKSPTSTRSTPPNSTQQPSESFTPTSPASERNGSSSDTTTEPIQPRS